MRYSRPTTTKTISKFSSFLHCVLDPDMLLLYRVNWTKTVDSVAETVRTICNNSVAALKRFLNTELAGPSGPTSQFEGDPTSSARHRPRAPSLVLALARARRQHSPPRAPSPACAVACACIRPRALSPVRLHSPARAIPCACIRPRAASHAVSHELLRGRKGNVTKGSAKQGA